MPRGGGASSNLITESAWSLLDRPLSADDDGGDWPILRTGTESGAAALRGLQVSRFVLDRMVDVDVDDMPCQGIGQLEPTAVARSEILD